MQPQLTWFTQHERLSKKDHKTRTGIGPASSDIRSAAQAREIFLNSLGKDHFNFASVDHNIGDIYYKIGQFDKAFDYFKEAVDIQSKSLSENHVDLAKSFNSIAAIHSEKENQDEALEYCKRAHEI
jgi:tetratricopeptide (TPR) repeat protein